MSKLSVSCPSCAKRYGVPDSYAGKKFRCKDCGAVVTVPGAEEAPVAEEPLAEETEPEPAPPKKTTARRRPPRRRPASAARRRSEAAAPDVEDETHGRAGTPARGRAGRRTTGRPARGRTRGGADHEHDGHYDHREPNRGLLMLSAVACVVLIVACVVYFGFIMEERKPVKKKKRRTVAEQSEAPSLPLNLPEEEEDPGFGGADPEPEPEKVAAKTPEKKPEAKKPEVEQPKKKTFPPLPPAKVRKIPHYAATSEEVRGEIDAAMQELLNPWGGAKANRKKAFLVKTGKPAVPALLSAMVELDFTNEEHRMVMPMITEALYDITKSRNSMICRVGMQESIEEQVYVCKYRRAEWFEWLDRFGKEYLE